METTPDDSTGVAPPDTSMHEIREDTTFRSSAGPVTFPFALRMHTTRFSLAHSHIRGEHHHRHHHLRHHDVSDFKRRQEEAKLRERSATDVVSKLTLDEKLRLISGTSLWTFGGIDRVGIPELTLADGPHGVRKPLHADTQQSHPATCFPPACALACGWDRDLCEEIGRALSVEAENLGVSLLLGPGMNLKRHPCGGRNFEYLSEDPIVAGQLGAALVRGIQESGAVGACAKHVAVNNQESHRFVVNAVCDFRTLRELYGVVFEYCIKKAQPWALMCAYNRVNGTFCSQHAHLFRGWVRSELGFGIDDADHEGALSPHIVMTDWGAVDDRVEGIAAGVDLEMPGSYGAHDRHIREALDSGRLTNFQLDACCARIVQFIQRASKRPAAPNVSDEESPNSELDNWRDEHHNLALRAAKECIVLLKNDDKMLPLPESSNVAIIGKFAKHPRFQGSGSSQVNPTKLETVLDLIGRYTDKYVFAEGYHVNEEGIGENDVDKVMLAKATKVAKDAKICICFIGLPEIAESEGFDRPHLELPSQHNALIREVRKVNQRTIVVLSNGGPVQMPWIDSVPTVLETYLAGQAGSQAVLDIIFGRSNPCGRLAETFPINLRDVLADKYFPGDQNKVEYREGLCVGYRYFDTAKKPVLFPFGHGLSYSAFQFTELEVEEVATNTFEVAVTVTNSGAMAGSEVVQCYVSDVKSSVFCPDQELKAFEKIHLTPGESKRVVMILLPHAFSIYDVGVHQWIIEDGDFEIRVGASSRDIRLSKTVTFQTGTKPSDVAIAAYPPVSDPGHNASDDAFLKRIKMSFEDEDKGVEIDAMFRAFPANVIHRNSLVSECQKTFFGRLFRRILVKNMEEHIEEGAIKEKQMKVIEAFADNFPLRGVVLFSEGSLSFSVLDWMIECMNGHYWSAFKAIFPILFCCRFRN